MDNHSLFHLGRLNLVFLAMLLSPVVFELAYFSEKPVALNLSDLFVPFYLVVLHVNKIRLPKILFFLFSLNLIFGMTWGLLGSLRDGSFLNILSSVRFYKCFLYILVGAYFSKKIDPDGIYQILSYFAFGIVFILILSDCIFTPDFPGVRWGGNFLNFQSYGFPNSFAVFVSFLTIFFFNNYSWSHQRCLSYLAVGMIALISIFSLSRAAMATFVIYWSLVLLFGGLSFRVKLVVMITLPLIACVFLPILIEYSGLADELLFKLHRTISSEDKTSGRYEIWLDTIHLIYEKLLFGYFFSPYSDFSEFGTPHNQYLEIFYKSGMSGFLLYFSSLIILVVLTFIKIKKTFYFNRYKRFVLMLLTLLIINMVQPNFSFSTLANFIFFLIGYFFNFAKARISKTNSTAQNTILLPYYHETNPPKHVLR